VKTYEGVEVSLRAILSLGSRWENNIKTDLKEIGYEAVDWVYLALGRYQLRDVVNTVMNLQFP
jgi:hypothetical protein